MFYQQQWKKCRLVEVTLVPLFCLLQSATHQTELPPGPNLTGLTAASSLSPWRIWTWRHFVCAYPALWPSSLNTVRQRRRTAASLSGKQLRNRSSARLWPHRQQWCMLRRSAVQDHARLCSFLNKNENNMKQQTDSQSDCWFRVYSTGFTTLRWHYSIWD